VKFLRVQTHVELQKHMQHYKSPPFHPKAVTPPLRALVLLLMQTAEQDKIATQSMGDDYIQRCTIFNEDNWR